MLLTYIIEPSKALIVKNYPVFAVNVMIVPIVFILNA
jgi:hypothetical protein